MFAEPCLPLTGNICDRRLWRIKGSSVGAAVDFVRRPKPHKQNRVPQEGNRWHAAGVSEGEKAINIKFSLSLPQSNAMRLTAPSSEGAYVCAKLLIRAKHPHLLTLHYYILLRPQGHLSPPYFSLSIMRFKSVNIFTHKQICAITIFHLRIKN